MTALADLLDDAAIWAGVGQRRLHRMRQQRGITADEPFGLDLAEPARFWFGEQPDEAGGPAFLPHLMASVAPGPVTVRWAWALDGLSEYPSAALSRRLADLGRAVGVPALTEPEVAIATLLPGPRAEPTEVAHRIGVLACRAVGEVGYHVFPAGAGTLGVLLLQPRAALPEPIALDLLEAVTEARDADRLSDHRRALWSATQRLRWPTDTRRPGRWWVRATDRPVEVHFDAEGRVLSALLS